MTRVLLLILVGCLAISARADLAYLDPAAMVREASVIAKVVITDIRPVSRTSRDLVAQANVETLLKGNAPSTFSILIPRNHDCAVFEVYTGPYVVFLRRDSQSALSNLNWDGSLVALEAPHTSRVWPNDVDEAFFTRFVSDVLNAAPKKAPNKAPAPTRTSGTPAAAQPGVARICMVPP